MAKIDRYFLRLKELGASDLHIAAGTVPKFRIHGSLEPMSGEVEFSDAQLKEMLFEMVTDQQKSRFLKAHDLDFAYSLQGIARFRCNFMMQRHGIAAVFRMIPEKIKSIEDLKLPPTVEKFAHLHQGLVLVTGPTGSGKSTTLAAIIDAINTSYTKHILTIEDPIEFVHENKKCLVTQREVGQDTRDFAGALRAAGREDADVILVGEMRDLETIALAITLSEMGQLVFGTLHTNSAAKTIDRIVDVFPPQQQSQIRLMLSDSLKGILAQQLIKTADGKARVAVLEILFGSPALANIIREGKTQQIISVMQGGKAEGMQTLDSALMDLVQKKMISPEDAAAKAHDKRSFDLWLKEDERVAKP